MTYLSINRDSLLEAINDMILSYNKSLAFAISNEPAMANDALQEVDLCVFRAYAILGVPSKSEKILERV
jgi:hypothetical protein